MTNTEKLQVIKNLCNKKLNPESYMTYRLWGIVTIYYLEQEIKKGNL